MPFCGEQCDMLDPEHETKHYVSVHRPTCFGSCYSEDGQIMTVDFCPAEVASTRCFHSSATKYEWHPYREYGRIYPDWFIPPDSTAKSSLYWMQFVGKYYDSISKWSGKTLATVPKEWAKITWQEVQNDLKEQYGIYADL